MPVQKWSDSIWVAKLGDIPVLTEDIDYLLEHVPEGGADVVLDFANVSNINSTSLSQLLRLRKTMVDRGRKLRIASVTDPVWAVLLTTGLDKVFHFVGDTSAALAELQIDGPVA